MSSQLSDYILSQWSHDQASAPSQPPSASSFGKRVAELCPDINTDPDSSTLTQPWVELTPKVDKEFPVVRSIVAAATSVGNPKQHSAGHSSGYTSGRVMYTQTSPLGYSNESKGEISPATVSFPCKRKKGPLQISSTRGDPAKMEHKSHLLSCTDPSLTSHTINKFCDPPLSLASSTPLLVPPSTSVPTPPQPTQPPNCKYKTQLCQNSTLIRSMCPASEVGRVIPPQVNVEGTKACSRREAGCVQKMTTSTDTSTRLKYSTQTAALLDTHLKQLVKSQSMKSHPLPTEKPMVDESLGIDSGMTVDMRVESSSPEVTSLPVGMFPAQTKCNIANHMRAVDGSHLEQVNRSDVTTLVDDLTLDELATTSNGTTIQIHPQLAVSSSSAPSLSEFIATGNQWPPAGNIPSSVLSPALAGSADDVCLSEGQILEPRQETLFSVLTPITEESTWISSQQSTMLEEEEEGGSVGGKEVSGLAISSGTLKNVSSDPENIEVDQIKAAADDSHTKTCPLVATDMLPPNGTISCGINSVPFNGMGDAALDPCGGLATSSDQQNKHRFLPPPHSGDIGKDCHIPASGSSGLPCWSCSDLGTPSSEAGGGDDRGTWFALSSHLVQ